ncbi:helix-turn-helix transcriptional regulator [Rhodoferax sp.]|uniref:helix-turn-helix domain-containing protein n=1 Tax=Rhodoferax sp. TaxID=50421 RepID=UPI0026063E65|nr:helix-turn-helix transcriptional regulator [Rhodoferax sp.]MDD5479574.1 helix-turn-helix transcriptional regulator [Rhodoferax sp.]
MPTQPPQPLPNLDHLDPLVSAVVAKRKQLRWSQAKLAQAAGISRRALLMIEKGGDCNLSTLRRLLTCLDIVTQAGSSHPPTLDDMNAQNAKDRFGGAL